MFAPFTDGPSSSLDESADFSDPRPLLRQFREVVEFDGGVLVLGFVVLARDRPEDVLGSEVGALDRRIELLRELQVDRHGDTLLLGKFVAKSFAVTPAE